MVKYMVATTPFGPGSTFGVEEVSDQEGVEPQMAAIPYKSLVKSLMYLAPCTKPDLAMAVSSLLMLSNPKMVHWEGAVRRAYLRYIKGSWRRACLQPG